MAENEKKADVRGKITSVSASQHKSILGSVRVEGKQEADTNVDAAQVRINDSTKLEKISEGKKVKASFSDLKVGMLVESGFVGPVAESYPVQANAGWLLILEQKK